VGLLDLQSTTAVSNHTVSSVNQILSARPPWPPRLRPSPLPPPRGRRCVPLRRRPHLPVRSLSDPPRFSRAIVAFPWGSRTEANMSIGVVPAIWERTLRMRLRPSSCSIPPVFPAIHPRFSHGVTHGLYLTRAPHSIPAPPILIHFCLEGKPHSAPGRAFFHAATLRRFTHTQTTALLWS